MLQISSSKRIFVLLFVVLGVRLCIRGEECDPVQLRSALAEAARMANEASVVRASILKNECGKECSSSLS